MQSPLCSAPGVELQIFRIDWLHAADQGVTADFVGNLLLLLSTKYAGNNVKDRVAILWGKIQEFYNEFDVQDRLQNLVDTMLKQPKQAPKLRASAAQCRALVPFAYREANRALDDNARRRGSCKTSRVSPTPVLSSIDKGEHFCCRCLEGALHQVRFAICCPGAICDCRNEEVAHQTQVAFVFAPVLRW